MTHRVLFLKHGFVGENAPLQNGIGRFIPQLQRITLKFCKELPSSFGIRQFIEHDIVQFAKENPHVAIYLKPRRHRSPVIVAEYLNGQKHWQEVGSYPLSRVRGWIDLYRTASGREFQSQKKQHFTENPTIQGMWHSYVNSEPFEAKATFPCEKLSETIVANPSASEKLKNLLVMQESPSSQDSKEGRAEITEKQ